MCPGALDALSDAADDYAPRAALAAACAELERAESDRFASRTSLEIDLDSSWAEEVLTELDVTASTDQARRSRSIAGLLIEHLLSKPSRGSLVPDRRDVYQLLDLASTALGASLQAQYAFAALLPAELEVTTFGDIDISPADPAEVDIGAWQQARLEEQASGYVHQNRAGQPRRRISRQPAPSRKRGVRPTSDSPLDTRANGPWQRRAPVSERERTPGRRRSTHRAPGVQSRQRPGGAGDSRQLGRARGT